MKVSLFILFLFIGCSCLIAQEAKPVTIKAGSRISDVLKFADIFYYPQFLKGKVFFLNGKDASASMNYNCLTDQMLFIDNKRDTMALTDEKNISMITIHKDTFYFDEGYLRQVANFGNTRLAFREKWELADVRKVGGFNSTTSQVGITSYSVLTHMFGKRDDLILNEDLVLRKTANYYVGGMNNRWKRADKRDLRILSKYVGQQ